MLSFRGTLRAEESLLSWVLSKERFLAEFTPAPAGARNDTLTHFSRNLLEQIDSNTGSVSEHVTLCGRSGQVPSTYQCKFPIKF
jgi:hypothetical protein